MTSSPKTWLSPEWHPDFGDPEIELESLRTFSNALLIAAPNFNVDIDFYEEGYMCVVINYESERLGELHWLQNSDHTYGFFNDDEELKFSNVSSGIKLIQNYIENKNHIRKSDKDSCAVKIGKKNELQFILESRKKDYCNIRIYLAGIDITSEDDEVYVPQFISDLKYELKKIKEYDKDTYSHYFANKSLEEVIEFILSTRDVESKNFDLEDDNIYPYYRFFDFGSTMDHLTTFYLPLQSKNYLYCMSSITDEKVKVKIKRKKFLKILKEVHSYLDNFVQ